MQLNILASGDMALAAAGILLRQHRNRVELVSREPAKGDLDAHHLLALLALAVGAARQAPGPELIWSHVAILEGLRLVLELLDFRFQRRQHARPHDYAHN